MGFFDKINKDELLGKAKNTFGNVTQTVKDKADTIKANSEQKKAERAAADAAFSEQANNKSAEIINTILENGNDSGIFNGYTREEILNFTKEFYDKIVLPASSVALTKITMHPYISQKMIDKFAKNVPMYDNAETPVLHIKADNKQELLITDNAFYFVVNALGNTSYLSKGRIPIEKINDYTFETDDPAKLICDGVELMTFKADKPLKEDFVSLNDYFRRIKSHKLEITEDEVDSIIREKIGDKVCEEVQKYMIYDDEKMVYFAWGVNSLSAKDYIVCTTAQIIVIDRELFGATADVKQLYYEDITSATTQQNSNNSDLTGYLIETALTAATKTCDLIISVAGSSMKINTLYKVEAERVVAVYHQKRKESKKAASTPQVVVQQTAADPLEQLQKLNQMKDLGVITQEEFDAKKADILAKL